MLFASPPQPILSKVCSRAAENSAQAWPRSSPVPLAIIGWSHTGAPRFLENPSHTFAPLSDPGRLIGPHLFRSDDAVPRQGMLKTPAQEECRDSITRLRYPLPTLQVMRYHTRMQGSLPVGG